MNTLEDIVDEFEPIGLRELDRISLLNRSDTKFTFNTNVLPTLLQKARPFYQCLEIQGKRFNAYSTLYYDTSDLLFYREHHNGKLNRQKVRKRFYLDSGLQYLEVKNKTNKDRTDKLRIKSSADVKCFDQKEKDFLSKACQVSFQSLMPMVWVDYTRLTFAHKTEKERLTIDIQMRFRDEASDIPCDGLVIAEVKREAKTPSIFLQLLKSEHIRSNSISKYCMALAFTRNELRSNNFKEKIRQIKNQLNHDKPASYS